MSALLEALAHPVNRPRPLLEWLAAQVNPAADLRGLEDGGGVLCDFRPGLEEANPSLSVTVGQSGAATFHRFGGDGFEGGAVAFTASCLGVSKGDAARQLIERAGIPDTPPTRQGGPRPTPAKADAALLGRALERLGKLAPLPPDTLAGQLKGWHALTPDSSGPEAEELARRGLLAHTGPGGLLLAYHFTGRTAKEDGKPSKVYRLPSFLRPGAVAFALTGPDGRPWQLKARNLGAADALEAAGVARYAYLAKGHGSPAWCAPGFLEAPADLVLEGELNAAAAAAMLEAAGYGGAFAVQGVGSASALPHLGHVTPGREAWIYADPDTAGAAGGSKWAALFHAQGAAVRLLPPDSFELDGLPGADACDLLSAAAGPDAVGELGAALMARMTAAPLWAPPAPAKEDRQGAGVPAGYGEGFAEPGDAWPEKRRGYGVRGGVLCALAVKDGKDGAEDWLSEEPLCNFAARITASVTLEDGSGDAARVFELEGRRADGRPFPPAQVSAAHFAAMNWPVSEWGAGAVVYAGTGKKDKARAGVQLISEAAGIAERTVYRHTGWTEHPEHGPVYLTAGAVLGAEGAVSGVEVELSGRLAGYALPDPAKADAEAVRAAVRASLELLNLGPDAVTVPALGAVYRSPLGRLGAAVWLTGETGRNKTALMGLLMAHYGPAWNREHLPDGWNSSANALERAAFTAKDALFLVDDFKPAGAARDVQAAQGSLSRVLQGVADGAGRGTLSADRRHRAGLYPRGAVMSSSETLPRGHSNRARVVVVDVGRPLIGKDPAMSAAYYRAEDLGRDGVYALALAGYVCQLARRREDTRADGDAHRDAVRALAPRFEGAHGRTGPALAELAQGWAVFLAYAVNIRAVTAADAADTWARVVLALEGVSGGQAEHLHSEDPVTRALSMLSGLLSAGRAYLEDLGGGPPPDDAAALCGWQLLPGSGEHPDVYRARPGGELLGWYSRAGGDEWGHFLPDALHAALQRMAQAQGGGLLPDAGTLWANMAARLHPAGAMRCEMEGGKVRRPMFKASTPGGRMRLITLRLPILGGVYADLGTLGTMGTDGEESTSDTAFLPVPKLRLFSDSLGTLGTAQEGEALAASSFAGRAARFEVEL